MNGFQELPWNYVMWGVATWEGNFVWGTNKEDIEAYPTRAPNSEVVKTCWGKIRAHLEKATR